MVLPIVAYGHPVLRKRAREVEQNEPKLDQLIQNMWETMYYSEGVGLAAPQVNQSLRIFIIDATPYSNQIAGAENVRHTFINPQIVQREGEVDMMEEGCLSIPHIREEVARKYAISIQYYDADWNFHDEYYSGMLARIIQHEYDHIEGILFTDHLSTMRKTMLRSKLSNISKGRVEVEYRMIFPFMKKSSKTKT
ncbi:MAG: peptide deformylase [Bacteroidales bacterium]|nr:peptide deformylase [Bacteroidales bacterium]MCF8333195.1 peptide deformylase [Bacteroidales bacterium]